LKHYIFGFIGFMVGVKLCDLIFYNAKKHEVEIEMMEEEFWKING